MVKKLMAATLFLFFVFFGAVSAKAAGEKPVVKLDRIFDAQNCLEFDTNYISSLGFEGKELAEINFELEINHLWELVIGPGFILTPVVEPIREETRTRIHLRPFGHQSVTLCDSTKRPLSRIPLYITVNDDTVKLKRLNLDEYMSYFKENYKVVAYYSGHGYKTKPNTTVPYEITLRLKVISKTKVTVR